MDEPQGGARLVALLARDLRELGEDATLYCHSYDRTRCFPDILAGVPVRAVENVTAPRWLHSGRGWRRVVAQLRRYHLEAPAVAALIEPGTELLNPHEWLAHRAAGLFARHHDTPVVWTYNDPSGWHVPGGRGLHRLPKTMFGWFDTKMVNRFAALTTLSVQVQAIARSAFTPPVHVVRSGVDWRLVSGAEGAAEHRAGAAEPLRLLSVGLLFPHRRLEDGIRAVHAVHRQGVACTYEILGSDRFFPSYGIGLRALAKALGVQEHVMFRFDSVSEAELEAAYARADVLVFPNENQAWGLVVLEAMVRGLPVIVSRGSGVHEVLTDGANAVLVDARRPDQIAGAIALLARDPARRAELGAAARRLVREAYTSRHYAAAMLGIFRSCVSSGPN